MADKTKPTKKQTENAIAKVFRRMSPTKKQYNEMNRSSVSLGDPSSKSCQTTSAFYTNMSGGLQPPTQSTSHSYPTTPTYSLTPAVSYQTINQSSSSIENQLLRSLHSTVSEATNIIEQYINLRKREKILRVPRAEIMSVQKPGRNVPVNKTEVKATPALKNIKVTQKSSTPKELAVMAGSRQSKAIEKREKARAIAASAYEKQGISKNRETSESRAAVLSTQSPVGKTGSVELQENLKNHQLNGVKLPDQKQIALRKILGKQKYYM
ncbi:orph-Q3 [Microplitis demolitor]|nr:orph-Q3 [Microplitis demolitor]